MLPVHSEAHPLSLHLALVPLPDQSPLLLLPLASQAETWRPLSRGHHCLPRGGGVLLTLSLTPADGDPLPPRSLPHSRSLSPSPPQTILPAHSQEGIYFDGLSPAAPHTTQAPEEEHYNHLTGTPGKGDSPQSSPGHSPSPGAPPTDDDVISSCKFTF